MNNADQLYFTSDTHFGHKKMLELRPAFKDVDEMDQWLVSTWNAIVPKNGIVFHLVGIDCPHTWASPIRRPGFSVNHRPFSFSEVEAYMYNRAFVAHDHHGAIK